MQILAMKRYSHVSVLRLNAARLETALFSF